ncbi:MAG: glycosyltransferase family 4 protein [Cyanobacteria bacterium P01_A01_bin.123]
MKVLHLSTFDIEGGAARAAYRVHQGLTAIDGITSNMLVRLKSSPDPQVIKEKSWFTQAGPFFNRLPLRHYTQRERKLFSPQWGPDSLAPTVNQLAPDIVNLHWVCNGYLRIETLKKIKYPLVWTLQDMWPMTGGCHYSEACDRYHNSCGRCPQLGSTKENDLSRRILERKKKAWSGLNLTIVAPSHWMSDCAKASKVFQNFRIEVIPFCLDLKTYRPQDKSFSRRVLNLPEDKKLILFGALAATADKRKGFDLLVSALQKLSKAGICKDAEVVVFGSNQPKAPIDLGFKSHYLGHLSDDISLSLVYSAADVMIVPSLQESFGQTTSEALACGTPVVAFNATGPKDIVDHEKNGYLAQPYSPEDLAKGIAWILEDDERRQNLSHHALNKAIKEFGLDIQAQRYKSLYEKILM